MSDARDLMVAAIVQGMISTNASGQTYGQDPEGSCRFYASQSVKLADAIIERMNPKIPIVPPDQPIPEPEELTQDGQTVG